MWCNENACSPAGAAPLKPVEVRVDAYPGLHWAVEEVPPVPQFILGIDPGYTGAATLTLAENGLLLAAWAWKDCTRSKQKRTRLETYSPGRHTGPSLRILPRHPALWGDTIAQDIQAVYGPVMRAGGVLDHGSWREVLAVAIEAPYIGRKNISAGLITAATAAGLASGVGLALQVQVPMVLASAWRPLFGIRPNESRARAKALSLDRVPRWIGGLGSALDVLGRLDHITDAGGVAWWRREQFKSDGILHHGWRP